MILFKSKQQEEFKRLEYLYHELQEVLEGTNLEEINPLENKITINGKEYYKKDLVEIDKKEFDASILRLETELTILKKL